MRTTPRLPLPLLLSSLLLVAAPGQSRAAELRIVSFNVWGLPFGLAADRDARIAAIGPALGRLKPDVVALQEVWIPENGETLREALAAEGLGHFAFQSEGFMGSGLLIASRYPFQVEGFTQFRLAGKPHKVWHSDWYARKGVLVVRLTTPQGVLRLANTHLHARYGTKEYWALQVTQALQAAEAVGTHGESPPTRGDDPSRPPLILCGDLNSERGEPALTVLSARAGLQPTAGDLRIDWVLARSGGTLAARVLEAKHVLEDPVELGHGVRARLSDHPCVLSTVRLQKRSPAPWRPREAVAEWRVAADAALPVVDRALRAAEASRASSQRWTVILLLAAAALFGVDRRRRRQEKKGCLLPLLTLALLHLAVWALYLGVVFEPVQAAELGEARRLLDAPLEASAPSPTRGQ